MSFDPCMKAFIVYQYYDACISLYKIVAEQKILAHPSTNVPFCHESFFISKQYYDVDITAIWSDFRRVHSITQQVIILVTDFAFFRGERNNELKKETSLG